MKAHVVVSAIRTPAPSPVLACFVRTPGEHYSMQNALSSTPQARIRTKSPTCERCVSYSSTPVVDQLTPID
jgi:hypothetical protein